MKKILLSLLVLTSVIAHASGVSKDRSATKDGGASAARTGRRKRTGAAADTSANHKFEQMLAQRLQDAKSDLEPLNEEQFFETARGAYPNATEADIQALFLKHKDPKTGLVTLFDEDEKQVEKQKKRDAALNDLMGEYRSYVDSFVKYRDLFIANKLFKKGKKRKKKGQSFTDELFDVRDKRAFFVEVRLVGENFALVDSEILSAAELLDQKVCEDAKILALFAEAGKEVGCCEVIFPKPVVWKKACSQAKADRLEAYTSFLGRFVKFVRFDLAL